MRFEAVKKDGKVHKLIQRFLESKYDEVEVFNEDDYPDNKRMAAAIRFVINNDYKTNVKVKHINGRVFLERLIAKDHSA